MKRNSLIPRGLALLLSLAMVVACLPIPAAAADVTVEVAGLLGTVTVKRAASEKTFNAFVGLKLKQGDVVTVAKGGEVTINIGADKTIRGLSDSSFKISSLSGTDADSQAGFTLIKGTVFNEVRAPQSSADGLTVKTGSTVAGVRGTTYSVSLRADGSAVRTLEGAVYLETVVERMERDTNGTLHTQQQTVAAGQGASAGEAARQLSVSDLTQAELTFIIGHPGDFAEDFVADAQAALDAMPPQEQAPPREPRQIVYEDEPGTTVPAATGSVPEVQPTAPTEPPEPPVTRTLTLQYGGDASFSGYYGNTVTMDITHADMSARLYDYLLNNCGPGNFPGKLGYDIFGWSLSDTGSQGTDGSRDFYGDHALADLPDSTSVTLYPLFIQNSQTGEVSNPYSVTQYNFPHFAHYAVTHPADRYYSLAADIRYTDYAWPADWQWIPIGDSTNPFTGWFKGNSKTIHNFSMDTQAQYAGLFGYIDGIGVHGLSLADAAITASGSAVEAVGGIAGYVKTGVIESCTVSGTISATGQNANLYTGGLVGCADYIDRDESFIYDCADFLDCAFTGNVSATGTGACAVYAGGIVGLFESCDLTDCAVNASVSATSQAGAFAGGIAGVASCVNFLMNSYSGAGQAVLATSTTTGVDMVCAGGMVGYTEETHIKQCRASGSFLVRASGGTSHGGGIVGILRVSREILQCAVTGGTIEAASGSGAPAEYAGGIAGRVQGSGAIRNCYAASSSVTSTHVYGRSGGIVGQIEDRIERCHVRAVSLYVQDSIAARAGGIAGIGDSVSSCAVFSGSINSGRTVTLVSAGRITSGMNSMGSIAASPVESYGPDDAFSIGDQPVISTDADKHGTHIPAGDLNQEFLSANPRSWMFTNVWEWDSTLGYPILRNVPYHDTIQPE